MLALGVARRTSPWTVGLELLGFVLSAPLVVVAIVWAGPAEAIQPAVASLVLLARAVSWWFRTYTVTDVHLELDEGILRRRHRTVPFARVQQVDLRQGLLHRLIGVATVRIETAGEGGATAIALKVLPLAEAAVLREFALSRRQATVAVAPDDAPPPPRAELVALGPAEVLLAAVTEVSVALVAAALLPIALLLLAIGAAAGDGAVGDISTGIGGAAAIIAAVGIGVVALVALGLLLQDWGYRLWVDGQDLHVHRGLLQVHEQTIPRSRLQQVSVIDNPVRRGLGVVSIVLHSAAGGGTVEGQSNVVRIPLVRTAALREATAAIAGRDWVVPDLAPRSEVARRRAVRRRLLLLLVVLGPTVVLAPLVALGVPWGRAAHRRAGHGRGPTVSAFASGVLHHRLDLVPRSRIQSTRATASPFQRRLGLATLWLDVAGGTARGPLTRSPHLHDLGALEVEDAMRALPTRRRGRRPEDTGAVVVRMHEDEVDVSASLVQRLLAAQLPDLADRPLAVVEPWGTDNAVWRLGDDLVVRLPRIHWAADQVDRDATWLPRLAPHLPVALPEPVAIGEPAFGYPYRWAVHRWLPGDGASPDRIDDPVGFALDLAAVVAALHRVPTDGAPPARNRARPLQAYDREARTAIEGAADLIDADAALAVWEEALAADPHDGPPVWVQGDLEGNCLVRDGRLCGIVDWGSACVGDPAVDVQVVWSPLFTSASRQAFLDALQVDDATVTRSRGAAVHQACAALPYYLRTYPLIVERSWHKLATLGIARRVPAPPTIR